MIDVGWHQNSSSSSFAVQDTLRNVLKVLGVEDFEGLIISLLVMSVYTSQHILVRTLAASEHLGVWGITVCVDYGTAIWKSGAAFRSHKTRNIPLRSRLIGSLHSSVVLL
jgi:hypothetical protein